MVEYISTSMSNFANLAFRIKTKFKKNNLVSEINILETPIIINNFNRLDCLLKQIAWLEKAGLKNIYIVDNASSYPPLLDFYEKTNYTVFKLNKNIGFLALWKTIIFQRFANNYYVYTDPDIIPTETCPTNALQYFYSLFKEFPTKDKIGFGLVINDLPNYYKLKEKVIKWETQFWQKEIKLDIYDAPIDTTFALYKPNVKGGSGLNAIRTGEPYTARHLGWYVNSNNLTEEDRFYINTVNSSSSWTNTLTGKKTNNSY